MALCHVLATELSKATEVVRRLVLLAGELEVDERTKQNLRLELDELELALFDLRYVVRDVEGGPASM